MDNTKNLKIENSLSEFSIFNYKSRKIMGDINECRESLQDKFVLSETSLGVTFDIANIITRSSHKESFMNEIAKYIVDNKLGTLDGLGGEISSCINCCNAILKSLWNSRESRISENVHENVYNEIHLVREMGDVIIGFLTENEPMIQEKIEIYRDGTTARNWFEDIVLKLGNLLNDDDAPGYMDPIYPTFIGVNGHLITTLAHIIITRNDENSAVVAICEYIEKRQINDVFFIINTSKSIASMQLDIMRITDPTNAFEDNIRKKKMLETISKISEIILEFINRHKFMCHLHFEKE